MSYIVGVSLLIIGIFIYAFKIGFRTIASNNKENKSNPIAHQSEKNSYYDLRNMALAATPDQLGLSLPQSEKVVYGVVMDWGIDDDVATIVSYQTGDASLYLSSGGGVIGGGEHQKVNVVSKKFVKVAQTLLDKTMKTNTTSIPGSDEIKFYLLTNHGIFVGQERIQNFENKSSALYDLFLEGQILLSEIRFISEKQ